MVAPATGVFVWARAMNTIDGTQVHRATWIWGGMSGLIVKIFGENVWCSILYNITRKDISSVRRCETPENHD